MEKKKFKTQMRKLNKRELTKNMIIGLFIFNSICHDFVIPIIIGVLAGIGSYFVMKYQGSGLFGKGWSYVIGNLVTAYIIYYKRSIVLGKLKGG